MVDIEAGMSCTHPADYLKISGDQYDHSQNNNLNNNNIGNTKSTGITTIGMSFLSLSRSSLSTGTTSAPTAASQQQQEQHNSTSSMVDERDGHCGVGRLSCNSSSCSISTATTSELMLLDEEMSPPPNYYHRHGNNNNNNNRNDKNNNNNNNNHDNNKKNNTNYDNTDDCYNPIHSVCPSSTLRNHDTSLLPNINSNNIINKANIETSQFSSFRHSIMTTNPFSTATTRPSSTITRSQSVTCTSTVAAAATTASTTTTTTRMTTNWIERPPLSGRLPITTTNLIKTTTTGTTTNNNNNSTATTHNNNNLTTHTQSSSSSSVSTSSKSTNTTTTTNTSTSSHLESRLLHPILAKIPIQFRFGFTGFLSNLVFMGVYNLTVNQLSNDVVQPMTLYAILYFFFIPASHFLLSLFVFGWPERYWKSLIHNFPIGLTALAIGCLLTSYLDQTRFNDYAAQQLPRLYKEWWLVHVVGSSNSGSNSNSGVDSSDMIPISPGLMGEPRQLETQDDDTSTASLAFAEVRRTLDDDEKTLSITTAATAAAATTNTMTNLSSSGGVLSSNNGVGELYSSVVVLVVTSLWTYVLSLYVNRPNHKGNNNNKSHEKEL